MLASMSEIDPRADAPLVDWSELSVSGLLPTGTVTLLLADVEGSTQLWETQPDEMTAAFARLDDARSDLIAAHGGMRPVEQKVRATASSWHSREPVTRCPVRWNCSVPRWRRSDCASVCIPVRCSCAMKAITSAPPSTERRGCAISATAARSVVGHHGASVVDMLPSDAWLTDLGAHELRAFLALNGSCNCVIRICVTNFRRYGR